MWISNGVPTQDGLNIQKRELYVKKKTEKKTESRKADEHSIYLYSVQADLRGLRIEREQTTKIGGGYQPSAGVI
jgi:hypothetical protein